MITIRDLTKEYPLQNNDVCHALNSLNLDIADGEWTAVCGPSGSGKTTLLKLISGLLEPTSGSCQIDGNEIFNLSDDQKCDFRREKLGIISQENNLLSYLTSLENIALDSILEGKKPDQQRAMEVLEKLSLPDKADVYPDQLSGGQKQRIAIGRILYSGKKIILADEPTGSLDPVNRDLFLKLIRELKDEETTIVMITHDPIAASAADRILYLKEGRIEN